MIRLTKTLSLHTDIFKKIPPDQLDPHSNSNPTPNTSLQQDSGTSNISVGTDEVVLDIFTSRLGVVGQEKESVKEGLAPILIITRDAWIEGAPSKSDLNKKLGGKESSYFSKAFWRSTPDLRGSSPVSSPHVSNTTTSPSNNASPNSPHVSKNQQNHKNSNSNSDSSNTNNNNNTTTSNNSNPRKEKRTLIDVFSLTTRELQTIYICDDIYDIVHASLNDDRSLLCMCCLLCGFFFKHSFIQTFGFFLISNFQF